MVNYGRSNCNFLNKQQQQHLYLNTFGPTKKKQKNKNKNEKKLITWMTMNKNNIYYNYDGDDD